MQPHEPFAAEFNEENTVLMNVELRLIDMELKLEATQEELVSSVGRIIRLRLKLSWWR